MKTKIFSILALIVFVLCAQISVFATSGGGGCTLAKSSVEQNRMV